MADPRVANAAELDDELDPPARRVLAIEGYPTLKSFAAALCEAFGFDCEVVAEGPWMVEAVRDGRFDALLMCVDRPVRDCIAAMRGLRELGGFAPITPIVAVTTDSNAEVCAPVDEDGLSFVMTRPVTASRLFYALSTAFEAADEAKAMLADEPEAAMAA